jgi:hypothetical protein
MMKTIHYRSGEPLRHPKSSATSTFSAACEAVPFPFVEKFEFFRRL